MISNDSSAMYIDYDNLFRSINESYSNYKTYQVVNELVKYIQVNETCDVSLVKAFCDFANSNEEINELQNSLVELRHINSVGQGKSNASDIGLAIDVIKSLSNKKQFEKYIIVSSDSDMLPLLLELKYQGKDVVLIYLESKIHHGYESVLKDNHSIKLISIEKILGIEKFVPISSDSITEDIVKRALEKINNLSGELYDRFKDGTTVGQKAILTGLEEMYEHQDAEIILNFLLSEKYLNKISKEVFIKGEKAKRYTFVINKEMIATRKIELLNGIKYTESKS